MSWSEKENRATVDAYFKLHIHQQAGNKVNKAGIYRKLSQTFGRSPKSYERKFQNISAVLYEQQQPYCDGLKPLHNYQQLLKTIVLERLVDSSMHNVLPHEILISKLRELKQVKVHGKGSGRFGLAIEKALGIRANSSKKPDFMGIELKTKHGKSLQTLFSRVPTRFSTLGGRQEFFDRNCYYDHRRERMALYSSFGSEPCSLGFKLNLKNQIITVQRFGRTVLEYDAEILEEALLKKLNQTVFMNIKPIKCNGHEKVKIVSVRYCKSPSILRFLSILRNGGIHLDFTLSMKNGTIKDHGFLWKVRSESIEHLFLDNETIKICTS